jgi:hypothetical protein
MPSRRQAADIIPHAHDVYVRQFASWVLSNCFAEFALLMDGSPLACENEALCACWVTRDFNFVQVCIVFGVFCVLLTYRLTLK